MVEPTGRPSLMLPLFTYRDYFARDETYTLHCHYAAVLWTYKINRSNAAAAAAQAEVALQIYFVV